MRSSPFSRANAMFAAIAAAMSLPAFAQRGALASVGSYESRGKGGKTPSRKVGTAANRRAAIKASNVRSNRAAHRRSR
ncbi:hypothetical protein UFOVP708_22 [uncultured Caudovirales phage]|uniref:Uncharacterized protein n=1 Tax=uncultured Caudovirales phage TaxID=2100421 RepID=A0A6J5NG74_9CAUD|nr:hypothetical protein UFOVP708_22 [uncultured Caudovirales phage]